MTQSPSRNARPQLLKVLLSSWKLSPSRGYSYNSPSIKHVKQEEKIEILLCTALIRLMLSESHSRTFISASERIDFSDSNKLHSEPVVLSSTVWGANSLFSTQFNYNSDNATASQNIMQSQWTWQAGRLSWWQQERSMPVQERKDVKVGQKKCCILRACGSVGVFHTGWHWFL